MELRDIEIFLALAEELHFGRTAERLHVTPARVSQSVKKQERRIGAPLFERTTRTVRLTPLGEQLHRDLASGYQQIMEGIHSATTAAGGVCGTLSLGVMGSETLMIGHVLDAFRARYPAVELRYREIQPTTPFDELRAGEVDAALVWLPVDEADLTVGPVTHISPVVLMVSTGHPLAARSSVCLEDLGDCTVLASPSLPSGMEEAFHPRRTPSGRPIRRGPTASSWHEQMSLVAGGNTVCAVVAEAASFYPWPTIAYLPIRDAPHCHWALVWRTTGHTPVIRALARTAADATPQPPAPTG
ncbi:LysR family transcriptional regulator [Streptomyces sp. TLI_185]|uniref:LysR substrate-binding domain-containing protein n=1 Tax=Streptomyces sp. TLI_185 TaxID=2485151 RepID=UPI000F4F8389|nr:LysR family transcriptional regulator [Streptomyces sp. TLI_185]RPF37965.1 LysR family transcriptional regulator [Streptomyces sp. TLI_185]